MEIAAGLVTGSRVAINRGGNVAARLLAVEVTDERDVQTVQLVGQAGEESNPPLGALVVVLASGEAYKLGVAVSDGITPDLPVGGKRIYSTDEDGLEVAAQVRLLPDGSVAVSNGAASFTMSADGTFTFSGTATHFDHSITVDGDVTAGIVSLATHVHGGVLPGPNTTGVPV